MDRRMPGSLADQLKSRNAYQHRGAETDEAETLGTVRKQNRRRARRRGNRIMTGKAHDGAHRNSGHPPKPRLCLRIGISGHRPGDKLPPDSLPGVALSVGEMLDLIGSAVSGAAHEYQDVYAIDPETGAAGLDLVIVSSLAEGADRIVARAGIERGFLLDAVLPFQRDDYAADFRTDDARKEYSGLLKSARSVFELQGNRSKQNRAYEAAGLVMLGTVDLLIAVWDGKDAAGIGGTALIVEKAISARVPVILIEPADSTKISLLWTAGNTLAPGSYRVEDLPKKNNARTEIGAVIDSLIAPPAGAKARAALNRYLHETERKTLFPLGSVFPVFLQSLFGRLLRGTDFRLRPYEPGAREDWASYFEPSKDKKSWPLDKCLSPRIEDTLLPAAAFADNLAVYYGSNYRGVYVSCFALAAFAVGCALAGVYLHDPGEKIVWVAIELFLVCTILILWFRGWRGDWHRRWLEYRRLGECLRHLRVLSLIGAPVTAGYPLASGTSRTEWTSWYSHAVRRCLPVPDTFAGEAYLQAVRDRAVSEIDGQIIYNRNNAARMARMERHIHAVGILLLGATLLIGGWFVYEFLAWRFFGGKQVRIALEHVTFFAALLPTIGAALSAIRVQADFETVAHRSNETVERLERIKAALISEPVEFALLADRIHKAVDAMTTDLDEWHVLFRTRPLSPPV